MHAPGHNARSVSPIDASPVPAVPLALEYAHVGPAEGRVAEGVADRIDGAVDVAEIVEEVPELLGYAARAGRQRFQQHEDVVGRPGDDEGREDGRQGLGRLLVGGLLLLQLFLLLHRCHRRLGPRLARRRHGALGYVLGAEGHAHVLHLAGTPDEGPAGDAADLLDVAARDDYRLGAGQVDGPGVAERLEADDLVGVHLDAGGLDGGVPAEQLGLLAVGVRRLWQSDQYRVYLRIRGKRQAEG